MTDDQIKHMVDKFLSYRFPEDIQPDGGLSIRRVFNEGTPHEFKATPSGTNLLNAAQATEMVRHMLEGVPAMGDGWRDIASAPNVPEGGQRTFLMHARWKNGEEYVFPADYLNAFQFDTDPFDDDDTPMSGTGWYVHTNRDDETTTFDRISSTEHRTLIGWRPLPPPPGAKP